jgi:2,3-diketo-5-methylthio-1-phosphopentane phosphatase
MFQIFCDFDGTISSEDGLKLLFHYFLPEEWPIIESQMHNRLLSEKEALAMALEKMPISPIEAKDWILNRVTIDRSFREFVAWASNSGFELKILSGGFDYFIQSLLERENLFDLEIFSNRLRSLSSWELEPFAKSELICEEFTHCKCARLERLKQTQTVLIYIGDGWTDVCPAQRVHHVFAKRDLRKFMQQTRKTFYEFSDFFDIRTRLTKLAFKTRRHSPGLDDEHLSSIALPPAEIQLDDLLR